MTAGCTSFRSDAHQSLRRKSRRSSHAPTEARRRKRISAPQKRCIAELFVSLHRSSSASDALAQVWESMLSQFDRVPSLKEIQKWVKMLSSTTRVNHDVAPGSDAAVEGSRAHDDMGAAFPRAAVALPLETDAHRDVIVVSDDDSDAADEDSEAIEAQHQPEESMFPSEASAVSLPPHDDMGAEFPRVSATLPLEANTHRDVIVVSDDDDDAADEDSAVSVPPHFDMGAAFPREMSAQPAIEVDIPSGVLATEVDLPSGEIAGEVPGSLEEQQRSPSDEDTAVPVTFHETSEAEVRRITAGAEEDSSEGLASPRSEHPLRVGCKRSREGDAHIEELIIMSDADDEDSTSLQAYQQSPGGGEAAVIPVMLHETTEAQVRRHDGIVVAISDQLQSFNFADNSIAPCIDASPEMYATLHSFAPHDENATTVGALQGGMDDQQQSLDQQASHETLSSPPRHSFRIVDRNFTSPNRIPNLEEAGPLLKIIREHGVNESLEAKYTVTPFILGYMDVKIVMSTDNKSVCEVRCRDGFRQKVLVDLPVVCIPSVRRGEDEAKRQKYIPPVLKSQTLKLCCYESLVLICVKPSEAEHYKRIIYNLQHGPEKKGLNLRPCSKECKRGANWVLVERPEYWVERGVRLAREPLLIASTVIAPGVPMIHIDDDRDKISVFENGKCVDETRSLADVVPMLLHILNGGISSGALEHRQLDIVALGADHLRSRFPQKKSKKFVGYDVTATTRASQAFLLRAAQRRDWLTFAPPPIRHLSAQEYEEVKQCLESIDRNLLAAFVGMEDYEQCLRIAAHNNDRTNSVYCNWALSGGPRCTTTVEAHAKRDHELLLQQMYEYVTQLVALLPVANQILQSL